MKNVHGKVWKYGDNINTDVIIPGRFTPEELTGEKPKEVAKKAALVDLDPDFPKKVNDGDILLVGENFGCGSSRENAVIVLKDAGVGGIIAKSFANIFFRNAINNCMPIAISSEAYEVISNGDEVRFDPETSIIENLTTGKTIKGKKMSPYFLEIMNEGGIIKYIEKRYDFTKLKN